jgi:hypothetical protein
LAVHQDREHPAAVFDYTPTRERAGPEKRIADIHKPMPMWLGRMLAQQAQILAHDTRPPRAFLHLIIQMRDVGQHRAHARRIRIQRAMEVAPGMIPACHLNETAFGIAEKAGRSRSVDQQQPHRTKLARHHGRAQQLDLRGKRSRRQNNGGAAELRGVVRTGKGRSVRLVSGRALAHRRVLDSATRLIAATPLGSGPGETDQ